MTDFLYDTENVTWGRNGDKNLVVRGLSSQDLSLAIKTHKDSLDKLFSLVEGRLGDKADIEAFGMELMDQFPELVALLIALAADMPDRAGELKKLPAPIQLRLVQAIYQLTLEDTGGLNDFLSRVFALLEKTKGMTHLLTSQQPTTANTGT